MQPQHEIVSGVFYVNHPPHRNNAAEKSQWCISEVEERDCFAKALSKRWILDDVGWGLHLVDGRVGYLGVGRDHRTPVFIAKFVDSNNTALWHGYPVDHRMNVRDRPEESVLKRWLDDDVLPRTKIRKLVRGQPCSL